MSSLRDMEVVTGAFRYAKQALSEKFVRILLEALVQVNTAWLQWARQSTSGFPLLYDSDVYYKPEPKGSEKWKAVPEILADGFGDCEDLAAWRAAEMRVVEGIPAKADIIRGRKALYHVVVVFPERGLKMIEDPSIVLGMPSHKPYLRIYRGG